LSSKLFKVKQRLLRQAASNDTVKSRRKKVQ